MPYILQSKVQNICGKITLAIIGFIVGLVLIPMWILFCIVYLFYYLTKRLLRLCGCEDCDCCSLTAGV